MTAVERDDLLLIGRVLRAHGLSGAVEVQPFSGNPGEFRHYQEIVLTPAATHRRNEIRNVDPFNGLLRISHARRKGHTAILELEGIKDRTGAERFTGFEVWVSKTFLPKPAPGEFYWHAVIGMTVVTREGQDIGRVKELFSTKAHDVLVVKGDRELLIPAVDAFVQRIDEENKTIIVDPPPGLLEMNG